MDTINISFEQLRLAFCINHCSALKALHCCYETQMACCECRSFINRCYESRNKEKEIKNE